MKLDEEALSLFFPLLSLSLWLKTNQIKIVCDEVRGTLTLYRERKLATLVI